MIKLIAQEDLHYQLEEMYKKINNKEKEMLSNLGGVFQDNAVRELCILKYCFSTLQLFTQEYFDTEVNKASLKRIEEYHSFVLKRRIEEILDNVEFNRNPYISQGYERAFSILVKNYYGLRHFVKDFYESNKKGEKL